MFSDKLLLGALLIENLTACRVLAASLHICNLFAWNQDSIFFQGLQGLSNLFVSDFEEKYLVTLVTSLSGGGVSD